MAVNAILTVFLCWLGLWPLRTVSVWDFASVASNFALGILLFFICAIAAPHTSEGPVDLDTYYQRARKPYYWLVIAIIVVSGLVNLELLKSTDPTQFQTWTIASVVFAVPPVLALDLGALGATDSGRAVHGDGPYGGRRPGKSQLIACLARILTLPQGEALARATA
jgi:hypothetical protein